MKINISMILKVLSNDNTDGLQTAINSFFLMQVNLRLDEELEGEEEDEGFYDVTLPGSETEVCPQFSRIFFEQFIRVFCIPLLG